MWKDMSTEERDSYEARAQADKERYAEVRFSVVLRTIFLLSNIFDLELSLFFRKCVCIKHQLDRLVKWRNTIITW